MPTRQLQRRVAESTFCTTNRNLFRMERSSPHTKMESVTYLTDRGNVLGGTWELEPLVGLELEQFVGLVLGLELGLADCVRSFERCCGKWADGNGGTRRRDIGGGCGVRARDLESRRRFAGENTDQESATSAPHI